MAAGESEVRLSRIIACFAPGAGAAPQTVARLAAESGAELLGLYLEDPALLRFAGLPFAAEIGFPSATRRAVDLDALERALRSQAGAVREALRLALERETVTWSLRVARGDPAESISAAIAEGRAPALLIPPRGRPGAERRVVRQGELTAALVRTMALATQPVLILPR